MEFKIKFAEKFEHVNLTNVLTLPCYRINQLPEIQNVLHTVLGSWSSLCWRVPWNVWSFASIIIKASQLACWYWPFKRKAMLVLFRRFRQT